MINTLAENSSLKTGLTAKKKRCRIAGYQPAETIRYKEHSTVGRVNACLKDEFGGRVVHVRGHAKIMCRFIYFTLLKNDLFS